MSEDSVFFPTPMVWATKSRTERSRESQPDGGLTKTDNLEIRFSFHDNVGSSFLSLCFHQWFHQIKIVSIMPKALDQYFACYVVL